MQVFLLFFIDGASFAENSDFWKYLIIFKKDSVYFLSIKLLISLLLE